MEILRSPLDMTAWSAKTRALGKTICLVPTMGYFHEGHLSLMRKAGELASEVVVSLFVNPMQFGANEDLDSYPSAFERDADMAEKNGAAVLFSPLADDVYPAGFQTRVEVGGLTDCLCGASRPGHFTGVTTVVAKLFHMVNPHFAIFGEKDFQQLAVIRKMVVDLNFNVEIVGYPIVREDDGLAMSSRNSYLDINERQQALCLSKSLYMAQEMVAQGERNAGKVRDEVILFLSGYKDARVDYVSIVDSDTLAASSDINEKTLLALAVRIGRTRLIDNGFLVGRDLS